MAIRLAAHLSPAMRLDWQTRLARLGAWSRSREGTLFLGLLALALLVRLPLAPTALFPADPQLDVTWGRELLGHLTSFYSYSAAVHTIADYPPLSIYLFALVVAIYSGIAHLLGAQPSYLLTQSHLLTVAIKLVPMACELALTAIIYRLARTRVALPWALAAAAAFAFSPYVLIIGEIWGQQDAVYVLAIVLALLLTLRGQPVGAGILSAAAVLLKPQPAVFLPLMAVYLWRWLGPRAAARYLGALAVTGIVIAAPFLLPPHPEILAYVHNVMVFDPATSSRGALNFWWLVVSAAQYPAGAPPGRTIPLYMGSGSAATPFIGPLSIAATAWIVVAAVIVWASVGIWRARSAEVFLLGACLVALAFYVFGTQQDVRYFLPAFVLLLIASLYDRRSTALYVVANVVITLNTVIYLLALSLSTRERAWAGPFYQWLVSSPWLLPFLAWVMLAVFGGALVLGTSWWLPLAADKRLLSRARVGGTR